MNRAVVISAAGRSERFSQSIGRNVNKVLYHEGTPRDCLLYNQLDLAVKADFQKIILVGGQMILELKEFVSNFYKASGRIQVVHNEQFETAGTAHSFALGVDALRGDMPDEVVLIEGDLFVDEKSFMDVVSSAADVITLNREPIHADKSVIFHVSPSGLLAYEYDTNHKVLEVQVPFITLGNSGQIWKFTDFKLLQTVLANYGPTLSFDTNLRPIEKYFNAIGLARTEFVILKRWINCNTVDDYRWMRKIKERINGATGFTAQSNS